MGKSTVLGMFRDLGAVTLETDEIVDMLLKDKSVLRKIRKTFGNGVFSRDGDLDRVKIASIIFKDRGKRDTIEEILHPPVFERIKDFLSRMKKEGNQDKIVIIEIPLMFEKGYTERFHKNITVHADEETTLRRLEGSGITRENAMMRLNAQMPIKEKIKMADFVVDNSGTLEDTKAQVREIYNRLLKDLR